MKIRVKGKLAPFSKLIVVEAMVPKTTYSVKVFPTKLEFYNREKSFPSVALNIFFKIKGPIKNFEVFQHIERSFIEVKGFSSEGFVRYKVQAADGAISLFFEKIPKDKIEVSSNERKWIMKRKGILTLPLRVKIKEGTELEKLSLGINKAQDMELINRREDLAEIFPIWFALGQLFPEVNSSLSGSSLLFSQGEKLISEGKKLELEELFKNIYLTGFSSIFVPSLVDEKHQGIIEEGIKVSESSSPIILLQKGYEMIRSLFLSEEGSDIRILGCLLPIFHSGRMVNICLKSVGRIDIEWSKKLLKKLILRSEASTTVRFKLQSAIRSFRVRSNFKDKGQIFPAGSELAIEKDRTYFFDKFQK